jgi:uncharacterized protein with PQ loop repeat
MTGSRISPEFEYFMLILPFVSNAFIYVQAYKIWKRQSHDDLSFLTSVVGIFNAVIWGYYGWCINSMPLLLSGIVAFGGIALILYLKLTVPSRGVNGWKYI